jgi:hypothetical protein
MKSTKQVKSQTKSTRRSSAGVPAKKSDSRSPEEFQKWVREIAKEAVDNLRRHAKEKGYQSPF